ncbi:MAG: hypothetical protein JW863_07050 [Chitinispirillaceae bacterium]|nr:hypothetical protein [Chitinispirillaceae bacterium]
MDKTVFKVAFVKIAAALWWCTIATTAAGLPDLLAPGTTWEYARQQTYGGGVTYKTNSYHRVRVDSRTERDDTVFITTAESLLVTTSDPFTDSSVQAYDSILSTSDTSWHYTYAIVTRISDRGTGTTLLQLDSNYLVTPEGRRIYNGFLPVIFPGTYYGDSTQFPLLLDDVAYSFTKIPGSAIYQRMVGLIYSSQYFFTAGGGSTCSILSYCDSTIDLTEIYSQLNSLQTPVTRVRAAAPRIHHTAHAASRYDFLGRKLPSIRKGQDPVLPVITSSERRIILRIRP